MSRRAAALLAAAAGCVVPERVELPPEVGAHQSMIFAVTSGGAVRVSAHSLPLDTSIEPWTASGDVTFVAFLYDRPLEELAADLSEGTVLDFRGEGAQPIPDGVVLDNREEEGALGGWRAIERIALPKPIADFRLAPRPSACPRYRVAPIPLPCEKIGEAEHDFVVMMLPGEAPGEALVTTSRGCAFLVRGDRALRIRDPERPYLWISGVKTSASRALVIGDELDLIDFVLTGTTVTTTSEPITAPMNGDHAGVLGGDPSSRDLYLATFHGGLWRLFGDRWEVIAEAPLDPATPCADPWKECHGRRSIVWIREGEVYVSNLREEIAHFRDGAFIDEPIDRASIPGTLLNASIITSLSMHPQHGLVAAYGALPAPLMRRDPDGTWRFFEQTDVRTFIYVMRPLGEGILFSGQQGRVGYVAPNLACESQELALGELHHLIELGDGAYLTGGDPQAPRGTLAVYRIELER